MAWYGLRITAYDMLESVQWSCRVYGTDNIDQAPGQPHLELSGAMQGRGAEDPTRWLRELLEEIRESL